MLLDDLGEEADTRAAFHSTRYQVRLAMLQYPLCLGRDAELRWLVAEAEGVKRFLPDAPRRCAKS